MGTLPRLAFSPHRCVTLLQDLPSIRAYLLLCGHVFCVASVKLLISCYCHQFLFWGTWFSLYLKVCLGFVWAIASTWLPSRPRLIHALLVPSRLWAYLFSFAELFMDEILDPEMTVKIMGNSPTGVSAHEI